MRGAAIPGSADESLQAPAKVFDSEKDVIEDPFGWAGLSALLARFAFVVPALAVPLAFLFASFRFASEVLLGIGAISAAWLGVLAAMLAFDCVPQGALEDGRFRLARRAKGHSAGVREFGLALMFTCYPICAAVFWVLALTIGAIVAGLFLF